jgi:acyl carrier protein phosphodiesterase
MPPRMRQVMDYLVAEDWLGSYADLAGVEISLNRLSRRIRFRNNLHGAIGEVRENYAALEQGFLVFFPALQAHMTQCARPLQSFR